MPSQSTVFKSNRSQAVRLPKDVAFPDEVKRVLIRKVGKQRIITPADSVWDDFFALLPCDDDFIAPKDVPPEPVEPL